jgi:hypothetical protein
MACLQAIRSLETGSTRSTSAADLKSRQAYLDAAMRALDAALDTPPVTRSASPAPPIINQPLPAIIPPAHPVHPPTHHQPREDPLIKSAQKAIVIYNGEIDMTKLKIFITKMERYLRYYPEWSDSKRLEALLQYLGSDAEMQWTQASSMILDCGFSDWKEWVLSQAWVRLDPGVARDELKRVNQYSMNVGVSDYFARASRINSRIPEGSSKAQDFQDAFLKGLRHTISAKVKSQVQSTLFVLSAQSSSRDLCVPQHTLLEIALAMERDDVPPKRNATGGRVQAMNTPTIPWRYRAIDNSGAYKPLDAEGIEFYRMNNFCPVHRSASHSKEACRGPSRFDSRSNPSPFKADPRKRRGRGLVNRIVGTNIIPVWANLDDAKLFNCSINNISTRVHIDDGCTGIVISQNFVTKNDLFKFPVKKRRISMANGSPLSVHYEVEIDFQCGEYERKFRCAVLPIEDDLILGIPFLQTIIVTRMDWKNHQFSFKSQESHHDYTWRGVGANEESREGCIAAVIKPIGTDEETLECAPKLGEKAVSNTRGVASLAVNVPSDPVTQIPPHRCVTWEEKLDSPILNEIQEPVFANIEPPELVCDSSDDDDDGTEEETLECAPKLGEKAVSNTRGVASLAVNVPSAPVTENTPKVQEAKIKIPQMEDPIIPYGRQDRNVRNRTIPYSRLTRGFIKFVKADEEYLDYFNDNSALIAWLEEEDDVEVEEYVDGKLKGIKGVENLPEVGYTTMDDLEETDMCFEINLAELSEQLDGQVNSTKEDPEPTSTSNHEAKDKLFNSLHPDIKKIVEPFLETVFGEPPDLKDIPIRIEDQNIELLEGADIPKFRGLRRLSELELKALKLELARLLKKGYVELSNSQYGHNILFVRNR